MLGVLRPDSLESWDFIAVEAGVARTLSIDSGSSVGDSSLSTKDSSCEAEVALRGEARCEKHVSSKPKNGNAFKMMDANDCSSQAGETLPVVLRSIELSDAEERP